MSTKANDSSAPAEVKRVLVGRIVSAKMQKTVTVLIERKVKHPIYHKIMVRSKKYHAHIEGLEAREGDIVEISEGRPLSKTKSWSVVNVVKRAIIV